jgi:TPR repeat protein
VASQGKTGAFGVTGRETEFFESVKRLEVPQDYAEAAKWYRKAAEQGHPLGQLNLGFMYGTGRGVPQNDVEAYVWYSVSAAQGDIQAATNRDIVARRMSRQEVVLGQQRAAAFVARKESASSERNAPSLTSIPAAPVCSRVSP